MSGLMLCMGCPVDADLMKLVNDEVTELKKEVDQMKESNKEEAQRVTEALKTVSDAVDEFHTQLQKLEEEVANLKSSQDDVEGSVRELEGRHDITDGRLTSVEEEQEKLEKRVEHLELNLDRNDPSQKVFIFNAPDRNPYFCGRTEQLQSLDEHMKAVENDGCKISAVCGLGGTGKTSLAVEHIWQQREEYKGVFWISGESNRAFQLSVCEMARRLGLDEGKSEFADTLSRALDCLQRMDQLYCLVVNNLDEIELSENMMKIFRGQWRRGTRGHILITTRREPRELSEDVGVDEEQCIELKNLTEEEGLQFLKMRTRSTSDKEDSIVRELVRELGGLPLALDQAAAYIRCVHLDFSSYLAKYKKEKLGLLKKRKSRVLVEDTARDRLAVHTTWSLNFEYVSHMSHEFGLGQAAAIVMEVSAYLAPDDIPCEIINEGLPPVENEDLHKCASDSSGAAEILSILTKFSLFQRYSSNSYSVHRLVQEVIRDRIADERVMEILGSAVRMLHFSFSHITSPLKVCTDVKETSVLAKETLPSLQLWGKLALHACILQEHLLTYFEHSKKRNPSLLHTEETVRLLSEASIYLSVSREIDKALELQRKKLELLLLIENHLPNESIEVLKSLKIPLTDREFRLISQCMKQVESSETVRSIHETREGDPQLPSRPPDEVEELRLQGNQAVQKKNYEKALDLYTQAIEMCSSDHRLFSNRALCYLKLGRPEEALEDSDRCLQLSRFFKKALMRKAWALQELVKGGASHLKNRAQAAADLTVYVDRTLSKELTMFPTFSPCKVNGSLHLTQMLLLSAPGTTLLLEEGEYDLSSLFIHKDLQIVGLGRGVTLKCTIGCSIFGCTCYFENVTFPRGNHSIGCAKATVSFHGCVISSGLTSCENFPECNGGPGCVAVSRGEERPCDRTNMYGSHEKKSGIGGFPGVQILQESTVFIDNCTLSHCGGGGMLCVEKSVVYVKKCEVFENHQVGLEARAGGKLIATNNRVYGNGFHGILVGPDAGSCEIKGNKIFENSQEGLYVVNTAEEVKVEDNDVYHNAPFGLSLERSHLTISKNRIFENGFWGILAKSRTNACITENVIHSNKCGGIFIGVNFSGRVVLDSNVIRDHTGPWLEYQKGAALLRDLPSSAASLEAAGLFYLPPGETSFYSHSPILKNNKLFNNEETMLHPRERIERTAKECGYCRRPASDAKLSQCSKCYIAGYCSRECQVMHWKKHKVLCAMVASQYSVTVEVTPFNVGSMRSFGPKLKGLGKGPRPKPKSHRRFIVKVQTQQLNSHPLQMLTVYDRSLYVDGQVQSPEVFNVVMECGVLGSLNIYTSKKAYFWAAFAEGGKKLTIFLDDLAPFQEW